MQIDFEKIATIISVGIITLSQIVLIFQGKGDKATRLEMKKQKAISKLTAKRDRAIEKGKKYQNEILEKEKSENVSSIESKQN